MQIAILTISDRASRGEYGTETVRNALIQLRDECQDHRRARCAESQRDRPCGASAT